MKWKNFRDLSARYPYLAHDIKWRITLAASDVKQFVRTKVDYIAFRPFSTLDLSSKDTRHSTPLTHDDNGVSMESYVVIEYQLFFHAEGEDDIPRSRYLSSDIGDGSIQAHIDDVSKWFERCGEYRDLQLIWDRVVKRVVRGSSYTGLTSMSLEIYPFPRHYRFRAMPWRVARGSWSPVCTNDSEFAPIIPGTTKGAW